VSRDDRVALQAAVGARKSFTHVYDFGDDWQHKIKVEKLEGCGRPA
jgi:hypothetical protein